MGRTRLNGVVRALEFGYRRSREVRSGDDGRSWRCLTAGRVGSENPMAGMRLGGIDPSILRELSGVYKPFVKAFKELVSNAFDADAEVVCVHFADDFSSVTVT